MGTKLVAGGLGAGAFFLIKSKFPMVAKFLKKTINSGFTRAAVFGAFSAMALGASALAKKASDRMMNRAKIYRELALKMRRRFGIDDAVTLKAPTVQYIGSKTLGSSPTGSKHCYYCAEPMFCGKTRAISSHRPGLSM